MRCAQGGYALLDGEVTGSKRGGSLTMRHVRSGAPRIARVVRIARPARAEAAAAASQGRSSCVRRSIQRSTTPPQHCARSVASVSRQTRIGPPPGGSELLPYAPQRSPRAQPRRPRTSRFPPPMVPTTPRESTSTQAPGSRGAEPRTLATMTRTTQAPHSRRASAALGQSFSSGCSSGVSAM